MFGALPLSFDSEGAFTHFPTMDLEIPGIEAPQPYMPANGYPTPESGTIDTSLDQTGEIDADILTSISLPESPVLIELVELFFRHSYHIYPCFHKASFISSVHDRKIQSESPIVLYAICAIAARYHPDPTIQTRQTDWYEQARFSYELTKRYPEPGLRTIQAAILIISHAFTMGDFSSSWLCLGKAWRQAVTMGMNRMDANHAISIRNDRPHDQSQAEKLFDMEQARGRTAVEKEEYRRTLWLLFFIDREISWPTGGPNAIDEQQFKVDIPVADSVFQQLTEDSDPSLLANVSFTRNLKTLISASATAEPLNMFHHLCIAFVLIGRVAGQIHSLHNAPNSPEFAEACDELDGYLVQFRLSLPRAATSLLEAPEEARGHVVWLNVLVNTISILLHFRCTKLDPHGPESTAHFAFAVTAAKSTAQVVKDSSRISTDLLLSVHVASSLFVAVCVLVIQWRTGGEETLKGDIDLFALVYERFNDVFKFLGLKFKFALEHDIKRSQESIVDLKERGFRGLLADCSKWKHVKEESERLGLTVS